MKTRTLIRMLLALFLFMQVGGHYAYQHALPSINWHPDPGVAYNTYYIHSDENVFIWDTTYWELDTTYWDLENMPKRNNGVHRYTEFYEGK